MYNKNTSPQQRIIRLKKLANALDTKWTIPGINIGVGYDTIIGLIPGIGDTATACISGYIVREAHLLGVPFFTKVRMVWNIIVDWFIGLIPGIGDLLDIGWKANKKNVDMVIAHAQANGMDVDMMDDTQFTDGSTSIQTT